MAINKLKASISNFFLLAHDIFDRKENDKKINTSEVKFKNIVIFSTTALGDLLFNTPAIRSVKERYPTANIIFLSSHKNKMLVENSPWFSNILYWDQKVKFLPCLVRKLRKLEPELAILLHSKSPYDIIAAKLSGCRYILKDNYNESDSAFKRWVTYSTVPDFKGHLIERKLSLVGYLGCNTENIAMSLPVDCKNAVNTTGEEIIIGFQLGASESSRCWPVRRFQELVGLLFSSDVKYRITLIGSAHERLLADSFLAGLSEREKSGITNLVGKSDLRQLVENIGSFAILITGDTGPLHIAVALKIPTVSLFVTANPEHTGPVQDKALHTVIRVLPEERLLPSEWADQPVAVITAREVMSAIDTLYLEVLTRKVE